MSILNELEKYFTESEFDFQRGDCNVYAVALHRKYDLPIFAAVGAFNDDGVKGTVVSHVFVRTPKGLFKDSDGEYTAAQMKAKSMADYFTGVKITQMDDAEAVGIFCDEPIPDFDDMSIGDDFDDMYDFDDYSNDAQCERDVEAKIKKVMGLI